MRIIIKEIESWNTIAEYDEADFRLAYDSGAILIKIKDGRVLELLKAIYPVNHFLAQVDEGKLGSK